MSAEPEQRASAPHIPIAERITVALVAKVAEALRRLQGRTGLSKTDAVNRSITVYEYFEGKISNGEYEIILRRRSDGAEQLVQFL